MSDAGTFLSKAVFCLWITGVLFCGAGCDAQTISPPQGFREAMREFVQGINRHAKGVDPEFLVIPQNGQELLTINGEADGEPATAYLAAIDGSGREDVFYGYDNDNVAAPAGENAYMLEFTDLAERQGGEVLVVNYCWTHAFVDDSYVENTFRGYISFVAPDRELRVIPDYPLAAYADNSNNVTSLADARNFLYLLNPEAFSTRSAYLNALRVTAFDLLIVDLFYEDDAPLTVQEVASLKTKSCGGTRHVVAYMSIGEAEDYRYYWQRSWGRNPPTWLVRENPDWPGNYTVRYWDAAW